MKKTTNQAIEIVTLGLRELIMEYFKGTCVNSVVDRNSMYLLGRDLDTGNRRAYQYERREHELKNPTDVHFYNLPLLTLSKSPNMAVFHSQLTQRSPEFQAVEKRLRVFFKRFLRSVNVQSENQRYAGLKVGGKDDKTLVSSVMVRQLPNTKDQMSAKEIAFNQIFREGNVLTFNGASGYNFVNTTAGTTASEACDCSDCQRIAEYTRQFEQAAMTPRRDITIEVDERE